jgi:hypothetical protein
MHNPAASDERSGTQQKAAAAQSTPTILDGVLSMK